MERIDADGHPIVFASEHARGFGLWGIRSDGSDPRRLTALPGDEMSPSWSPDGTHLAFECGAPTVEPRCVLSTEGTSPSKLTSGTLPQGGSFLFTRWRLDCFLESGQTLTLNSSICM